LTWRNSTEGTAATSLILDVAGAGNAYLPLALTESFSFAGVPNGVFRFSVRAVNAYGTSAPSNPVTLSFPGTERPACSGGAPQAPSAFTATRAGNVVSISWQPPTAGTPPTTYVVNVDGSFSASIPTAARALSGTVGAGTYVISVSAVNACGTGPATPPQTVIVP
jgi:predicted phage tail protein